MIKKSYRKTNGQNLVELVIVLPLLVLLILGIIQFGLYWRTFQTIESVALDGSNAAASTIDDPSTPTNEAVTAAVNIITSRLTQAGLPNPATAITVTAGTAPNALYQTPAVANPNDVQITVDYRNPNTNGVVVQVVYGYRPILAGTSMPIPGGDPITIIPEYIEVGSSQIQQYNIY